MLKVLRTWLDHFFADEQALLLVVLLALGLTSVLMFGSTLAPVIASMILAYLTFGLVQWLERFGVRHLPAVWGIYCLFIALLLVFVFVTLPLLWHQATALLSDLPLMLDKVRALFMLLPEQYPDLVTVAQIKQIADAAMSEAGNAGQLLLSFSLASIGQSITLLVYLVLVPILVFFFLKDGHMMVRWITAFLPAERSILSRVWLEMDQQIANYVRGKVIEIIIVGGATYVAFLWLG
ncbi:MAG: AI-2E family transporter, partial [Oceanospirillaceae bacterium]|nr:AI-2E family transporter [Oceanospirillaceae bacterium]